jgi:nucleotide-binding universal stress UspA family protein
MSRIRRILHASDFSRASGAAFKKAVEMAKANRAELLLVHPIVPLVGDGYVSPKIYKEMEASARAYAQKRLNALVAKAKQAGVRAKALLLEGVPHERIAQAARSKKADLVVIGTHGRTGFAKLFLGSVASRVVAIAPRPVLTVRGK